MGFWKSEEEGVRCLMEFEKLKQHSVEKNVEGSGKKVRNHASIVVALISCKNNHMQRKLLLTLKWNK